MFTSNDLSRHKPQHQNWITYHNTRWRLRTDFSDSGSGLLYSKESFPIPIKLYYTEGWEKYRALRKKNIYIFFPRGIRAFLLPQFLWKDCRHQKIALLENELKLYSSTRPMLWLKKKKEDDDGYRFQVTPKVSIFRHSQVMTYFQNIRKWQLGIWKFCVCVCKHYFSSTGKFYLCLSKTTAQCYNTVMFESTTGGLPTFFVIFLHSWLI